MIPQGAEDRDYPVLEVKCHTNFQSNANREMKIDVLCKIST